MGPRAGLERCGKSRNPPSGFDPRTVQPVASRYTDYATRPTCSHITGREKRPCEPMTEGRLIVSEAENLIHAKLQVV